jgi:hypothetical protein
MAKMRAPPAWPSTLISRGWLRVTMPSLTYSPACAPVSPARGLGEFACEKTFWPVSDCSHTTCSHMFFRRQRIKHNTRKAAFAVAGYAAIILGSSLLFLLILNNRPSAAEAQRFYTTIPGIDLRAVTPARLPALLRRLNGQRCTCECMRTLASCRNHHQSCRDSIELAQRVAAER